jgi:hypothetical protein
MGSIQLPTAILSETTAAWLGGCGEGKEVALGLLVLGDVGLGESLLHLVGEVAEDFLNVDIDPC